MKKSDLVAAVSIRQGKPATNADVAVLLGISRQAVQKQPDDAPVPDGWEVALMRNHPDLYAGITGMQVVPVGAVKTESRATA